MSGLLGGLNVNFAAVMLQAADERASAPWQQWSGGGRNAQVRPWEDGMLWPRSRMSCGDPTAGITLFGNDSSDAARWGAWVEETGNQGMLRFRGITRDATGALLGNVVLDLFLTATDVKVGTVTSDANGYFELPNTDIGQNHYFVAYKTGSRPSS